MCFLPSWPYEPQALELRFLLRQLLCVVLCHVFPGKFCCSLFVEELHYIGHWDSDSVRLQRETP